MTIIKSKKEYINDSEDLTCFKYREKKNFGKFKYSLIVMIHICSNVENNRNQ